MQSKCVPNNQLNSCAKTTMTGTSIVLNLSFCLSCTEHPFKCKDFRVVCLPSCLSLLSLSVRHWHPVFNCLSQTNYIRSSWNSFKRFREPNSPSLLTKSNHRTLDRSFPQYHLWFQTNRSQASRGVHPIQNDWSSISIERTFAEQLKNPKPMYHSKILKSSRKSLSPCSCLANPEDRFAVTPVLQYCSWGGGECILRWEKLQSITHNYLGLIWTLLPLIGHVVVEI